MATSDHATVSFDESDTRSDEMHSTFETWVEDLIDLVNDAAAGTEFQEWLDVQSRFHEYSYQNSLLIKLQCPDATQVAGYRTWQTEFDRHVKEGETAIWIRAPIITKQCPTCGSSSTYHEGSDCEYDETPSEEWSSGLVGFRPVAVFDVSQTEGEPLPVLDIEAVGESESLVTALVEGANKLGVETQIVPVVNWSYGTAKGVCRQDYSEKESTVVAVKECQNNADLAVTLIHEYAHAILHFDIDNKEERSKREVEAESVAYIVGRYFGLDTSGSALYLAAWQDEDIESIRNRLNRIRRTAVDIIEITD